MRVQYPGVWAVVVALALGGCGPRSSAGDDNSNNNNVNDYIPPNCGDGLLDPGEICDDGELNSDVTPDSCRMNCQPARCGDGVTDSFEQCDGATFGGATCADHGFSGGDLQCNLDCTVSTSGCNDCGNGVADGTDPTASGYEACDGDDLRGEDCDSQGFPYGVLACLATCALDTSDCSMNPPVCGNGIQEATEECDGADLNGADCSTLGLGFNGGVLDCNSACFFNTTGCYACGNGVVEPGEACDDGNTLPDFTCSADCALPCTPGYAECNGDVSTYCAFDGSEVHTENCDPLLGSTCDVNTGRCVGPCSANQLGSSYIGCDYYPTVTLNAALTLLLDFAVAVSNSGNSTANVTVTQGAATIATTTVAPGDIAVIPLPWNSLRTSLSTTLVTDGAYRLRTDQPVTVYQYNPIDYTNGGTGFFDYTYTNDAALLLPTNTWTGDYRVVSRQQWVYSSWNYPGFYSIVASQDNTTVVLTPSATGGSVSAGAGVASNGTGTVVLHAGDVLQVTSTSGDLTGTLVTADKPVQVIGGHDCTNVPNNVTACDHLEEAIPPLQTVGYSYIVTAPLINASTTKGRMVRVVATAPNTQFTYDPPQAGAPASMGNAGDYFEIAATSADFMITANEKILVAEYMQGQDAGGGIGDPAMTLAVAVLQYRPTYLFHAPLSYPANYVNITATTGATVTLDGAPVTNFTAIGATGYSVARLPLSNAGNGNHTVTSSSGAGITVYGYGSYTSYWYPGGLNLTDI